jgi:hypothetical protein
MKTYVVECGFAKDFTPPLTKDQLSDMYSKNFFQPIRDQANELGKELVIKEELNLIGRAIVYASEKAAKTLRQIGFKVLVKKSR